jgi:hypothetical protein
MPNATVQNAQQMPQAMRQPVMRGVVTLLSMSC